MGKLTIHEILLSFPPLTQMSRVRLILSCSPQLSPQVSNGLEVTFNAPVLEAFAKAKAFHQITSISFPEAPHSPVNVELPRDDIAGKTLNLQHSHIDSGIW